MDRWVGKVAIVTGASSGIGAEIADSLVRLGLKVVGLARRVERVKENAEKLKNEKGQLFPFECDLRKENDILKAFQWVENELGGLNILINNAGVAHNETIMEGSTESFRNILDVNVLACAITSREAIKSLKKRNAAGHIVLINSILSHHPDISTRPLSVYIPSKFAITGLVATLHNEIAAVKLNIKVTSISPGIVDTELPGNVGFTKEIIESLFCLKTKDVADAVIYTLSTPPDVQVNDLVIMPVAKISPYNNIE